MSCWSRAAFFLIVLLAAGVLAADWPQWRGPQRNGHVPADAAVPKTLAPAPKVLWRRAVGFALASPVVSGGRVFYSDLQDGRETLHAADAVTGDELWSQAVDEAFKDNQTPMGPRCTPLVSDGLVFAQSCRGELQCRSAADGRLVWRTNYVKDHGAVFIGEKGQAQGAARHGYNAPPIVDGERLIALAGGRPDAAIICFDKRSGKILWKAQEATPAYAAPVLAEVAGARRLLAFMADGLMAVDPDNGRLLWRIPIRTSFGRHVTAPVVVGDQVVVSSHQAGLIAVAVTRQGDDVKAQTAWTSRDLAINFMCPVAVGGYLYGIGPQKNIICVNIETGKAAWSKEGYLGGSASNAYAGMIAMNDQILMLTDRGEIVLFAADPQRFHEIARAQVAGQNWCNPAYADGRLYLRDAKNLVCVELVSK